MEKSAILNKYSNDEDKLFISKILDKIKLAKTSKRRMTSGHPRSTAKWNA